MPKGKSRSQQLSRKSNITKKNSNRISKKIITIDELIEKANDAIADVRLEEASQYYSAALAMSPESTKIMDALSEIYIQIGLPEEAMQLLTRRSG